MSSRHSVAGTVGSGGNSDEPSRNVQVAVRCRPLNSREKSAGFMHVVSTDTNNRKVRVDHKKTDRTYGPYDMVFGPYATQSDVFEGVVRPIVQEVLQGYNCTVFAYGQTGTGKTYTMEGDISSDDHMGVIPRSVHAIFEALEGMQADYTTRVSFLELYNEELQDLLVDSPAPGTVAAIRPPSKRSSTSTGVVLREGKNGVVVCGLEEIPVLNAPDILKIMEKGIKNRSTAATLMNKNSSRSHSIFTIKMMIKETLVDGQEFMRHGQLNLVDLAGSECVGRSGATGDRGREAGNINQSLLTLGRVITALVEKHGHVPYRDSKLTRLLQESLGGKAKTCIISTVTSSSDALEETISTLDYALKAKSIENRPQANERLTKKHMMKEVSAEMESLRSMLQATREKNGMYIDPEKFDQMENTIASQANQIAELEQGMEGKSEEVKNMRVERDMQMEARKKADAELYSTRSKLSKTEESLASAKENIEALTIAQKKTADELERVQGILEDTQAKLHKTEDELASTRGTLRHTQCELEKTKEDLEETRVEIFAHAAVVREQKATEEALQRQAASTKRSLEEAVGDISKLHSKRAKLEEDAAAKRLMAKQLETQVAEVTSLLTASVAQFQEQHISSMQDLHSILSSATADSKENADDLISLVSLAMDRAAAIGNQVSADANAQSKEVVEQLAFATKAVAQGLKDQQSAISGWQKRVEGLLSGLQSDLSAQAADMHTLCSSVSSAMDHAHESIDEFVGLHAEELRQVKEWADVQLQKQAKELEEHKREAVEFADQRRADVQAQADRMVAEVRNMMDKFKNNTVTAFQDHTKTLSSNYDASVAGCLQVGSTISSRVDAAGTQAKAWSLDLQHSIQSAKADSTERITQLASSVATSGSQTGEASAALHAAANKSCEALGPICDQVLAANESAATSVSCLAQRCASTLSELAQARDEMNCAALDRKQKFDELIDVQEQAIRGKASAAEESVLSLKESHEGNVASMTETVTSFVGRASAELGLDGMPHPREYACPPMFSSTRSHSTIMDEARLSHKRGRETSESPFIATPPSLSNLQTTPPPAPVIVRDAAAASEHEVGQDLATSQQYLLESCDATPTDHTSTEESRDIESEPETAEIAATANSRRRSSRRMSSVRASSMKSMQDENFYSSPNGRSEKGLGRRSSKSVEGDHKGKTRKALRDSNEQVASKPSRIPSFSAGS